MPSINQTPSSRLHRGAEVCSYDFSWQNLDEEMDIMTPIEDLL